MAHMRQCPQCGHNDAVYAQASGRQVCALCMSETYDPSDKDSTFNDGPMRNANSQCGDVIGGTKATKPVIRKLHCSDKTPCKNRPTTEYGDSQVIIAACHLHE